MHETGGNAAAKRVRSKQEIAENRRERFSHDGEGRAGREPICTHREHNDEN
jgi:hypothetical protein